MERELTTSQGTQPPAPGCPGPSKAALGTSRSDSRPSPHLCLPEISLPCPEQRSLVKPAALSALYFFITRVSSSQEEGFQNITERHCGQFVQKKGNQKRSKNCRCSRLRPCRVGRGQGQGRACQPAGEAAACPDPQGRSGRRGKEGGNWEMTAGLPRGFAG